MKLTTGYDLFGTEMTDPAACIGCGVCMLSCPVWQQHHAQELTYCGRARVATGGTGEEECMRSVQACILCGSCEPLCHRGIATTIHTIRLRQRLARRGILPGTNMAEQAGSPQTATAARIFLPGAALRSQLHLLERVLRLLGDTGGKYHCAADDGTDIILALESGGEIKSERFAAFLGPLRGAGEIIASDGLLVSLLPRLLGAAVRVRGLGSALLGNEKVRSGVKSSDFYMIETRAYNAQRNGQVMLYESLRRGSGCSMNMDLHRVATPTGAMGHHYRAGLPSTVSVEAQVRWLLEGRKAERIVVEHPDDGAAFERHVSLPVVHLAEVAGP